MQAIQIFHINDQDLLLSVTYLKASWERLGQSPLHVATIFSSAYTAEQLLLNRDFTETVDYDGYTPLYVSCSYGSYLCTLKLLQHVVNPSYAHAELYPNHIPRSALNAICNLAQLSNSSSLVSEKTVTT